MTFSTSFNEILIKFFNEIGKWGFKEFFFFTNIIYLKYKLNLEEIQCTYTRDNIDLYCFWHIQYTQCFDFASHHKIRKFKMKSTIYLIWYIYLRSDTEEPKPMWIPTFSSFTTELPPLFFLFGKLWDTMDYYYLLFWRFFFV